MSEHTHTLTVLCAEETHILTVPHSSNLRQILLDADLSPYATLPQTFNCGGRGLCATCGVRIIENTPAPQHWHDKAANAFGYPRLSCQITIEADMIVRLLTEKMIWGNRKTQY